jgi:hypothetical protein
VHDRVRRQRHLVALVRAAPTSSGPCREAVGLLRVAARRADEAVREVAGEQVGDARLIVREDPLEVRERLRSGVARRGDHPLSLKSNRAMCATSPESIAAQALGVNRIGIVGTTIVDPESILGALGLDLVRKTGPGRRLKMGLAVVGTEVELGPREPY